MRTILAAAVLAAGAHVSAAWGAADAIYSGGPIVTLDDARPLVEAVAVKSGRIVAAGTRAAVEGGQRGPRTRLVDLAGRTLVPGFIDAHGHMSQVGLQAVAANILPAPDGPVNSIAALQEQMRSYMATSPLPKKYGLVIGFGYDDSQLKEQRHPTREDLDAITTELPLLVIHQSGHLGAYNSRALALAGIGAGSADPQGGVIRRKAGSKEPDGVLEETAHMSALLKVLPNLGQAERIQLVEAGQALYTKYGFTTAQDGRADPGSLPVYRRAAETGKLKIDVAAYLDLVLLGERAETIMKTRSRTYDRHFRLAGVKLNFDGSPQGKTAWLTKPYFKAPEGQPASYTGYPTFTDEVAVALFTKAFGNGWQVLTHANGDAAIEQLIRAVRGAKAAYPGGDPRPVMIHGQAIREDQVDAVKSLGIFPALFPMHTFYWGDWHRDSVLGPERAENISPTGWLMQRGMIFSSHHDAPVAFPDSIRVLSATVNRVTRTGQVLGAQHRVEPTVGLKSISLWAAYQHFEEKTKGSIEVGKLADFVVLSDNPLTIPREKLADLKVVETIKQGQTVYRLDAAKAADASCMSSAACSARFTRAAGPLAALLGEPPHMH